MKLKSSITLDSPAEAVFALWSDVENSPEWVTPVLERRKVTEGPIAVGTRFRARDKWPVREVEFDMEITEYEENRRLGAKWSEPVEGAWTSRLTEVEGGTRLDFEMEVKLPLLIRLFGPFTKWWADRQQAKFMQEFKTRLENN